MRTIAIAHADPAKQALVVRGGWPMGLSVGTCVSLTVLIGLIPAPVANATRAAALAARAIPNPESSTVIQTDAGTSVRSAIAASR